VVTGAAALLCDHSKVKSVPATTAHAASLQTAAGVTIRAEACAGEIGQQRDSPHYAVCAFADRLDGGILCRALKHAATHLQEGHTCVDM
jgi:hypothetical protein